MDKEFYDTYIDQLSCSDETDVHYYDSQSQIADTRLDCEGLTQKLATFV